MKVIGHLINTYLRLSENFIYDQIKNIKSFKVEILTRQWINRDRFSEGSINSLECKNKLKFYQDFLIYTLFRKSNFFEMTIKEKNISLLHAHYGIEGVYALNLKKKFNIPLITSFYGHDITRLPKLTFKKISWFNYWLYFGELKSSCELFLPVCNFLRNKLIEKGFPHNKVNTHYIGINLEKIQYVRACKKENIILTAGRLVEKKGIEYLLRAMELIIRKNREIKLLIVGKGELENKLKNLSKKLQLEKNVFFLGWQSRKEIYNLMREVKIFVLPSVTAENGDCEGLPTVILEAMSHELPVVGTYHAGIPEVVIDGETGFLVPEKDYIKLAEKIEILLKEPFLVEQMGKRGRKLIEEKFYLPKQISKLEAIYLNFL